MIFQPETLLIFLCSSEHGDQNPKFLDVSIDFSKPPIPPSRTLNAHLKQTWQYICLHKEPGNQSQMPSWPSRFFFLVHRADITSRQAERKPGLTLHLDTGTGIAARLSGALIHPGSFGGVSCLNTTSCRDIWMSSRQGLGKVNLWELR